MKKKNKRNLFNNWINKKVENKFLKTSTGKIMFAVLIVGIILITLGFGISIFELFLFMANIDIFDYSYLIALGLSSGITGLICNILYFLTYWHFKNHN